nr:PREDICTED: atherin-like isoform X2 [Latimeria chalumnae]|eukprot:XP_014347652.1 PREDICTED: atherin-like isoform X2 [Latimeria chalumnae]
MADASRYRDWILDTIDSLRSRKARPDLERICKMVRRKHGSDPERTRAELEQLVQSRAVLRVSYKGSISYRNAAKTRRRGKGSEQLPQPPPPPKRSDCGDSSGSPQKNPANKAGSGGGNRSCAAQNRRNPGAAERKEAPTSGCGERSAKGRRCKLQRNWGCGDGENGGRRTARGARSLPPAPLELGQQMVRAVERLALRSLRRGQEPKAVTLKELMRVLSSELGLPKEKVTKSKVKGALEKEVAKGRLKRSRFGNITLPGEGGQSKGNRRNKKMEEEPPDDDTSEEELSSTSEDQESGTQISTEDSEGLDCDDITARDTPKEEYNTKQDPPESCTEKDNREELQTTEMGSIQEQQSSSKDQNSKDCGTKECSTTKHPPETSDAKEICLEQCFSTQCPSSGQELKENVVAEISLPEANKRSVFSDESFKSEEGACELQDIKDDSVVEMGGASYLLTPSASPADVILEPNGIVNGENPLKKEKPLDPVEWTVTDVVDYFKEAGFVEQAVAFQEQRPVQYFSMEGLYWGTTSSHSGYATHRLKR